MLSVVIPTHDSESALLRTLAALVPGAAAGMVREVIVADAGSRDDTVAIADGAGCRVRNSRENRGERLLSAARDARSDWLLFLTPGTVPDADWIDEIRRFIETAELQGQTERAAAVFRAAASPFQPVWREAIALVRIALGGRLGADGSLLIAKNLYGALGGHRGVAEPERDLIRRLGRRRIVLLRTRALIAPAAESVRP
jgi:glycosyltransferase involved in cell wall biosynthesis